MRLGPLTFLTRAYNFTIIKSFCYDFSLTLKKEKGKKGIRELKGKERKCYNQFQIKKKEKQFQIPNDLFNLHHISKLLSSC